MHAVAKMTKQRPAMTTPFLDVVCVGGASIVVVLVLLLLNVDVPANQTFTMALIGFFLNAPHFMASYKLLYGDADRRRDYRRVSVYVPAALFLWMIGALAVYHSDQVWLEAMFGTAGVLLAWHYTGQAWGMMASFGFIEGYRFNDLERRLIRANLYVLLVWHVFWAVVVVRQIFAARTGGSELPIPPGLIQDVYPIVSLAALISSLLGLAGLVLSSRRLQRLPTLRMIIPWIAIHLWYVLMYQEPAALFWVQQGHALQYLIFPMRVEMNRRARGKPGQKVKVRKKQAPAVTKSGSHLLKFYLLLFVAGILFMQVIPEASGLLIRNLGIGIFPLQVAIVAFVNIHHFFIDNVIWKIRNPVVRDDLFSHLQPRSA